MSEPKRWVDGADAPPGVRDLFAQAERPVRLGAAAKARSAAHLAKLTAAPVASTAGWLAAKGLAAVATIGLASAALVALPRGREHGAPRASAVARAHVSVRPLSTTSVSHEAVRVAPAPVPPAPVSVPTPVPVLGSRAVVRTHRAVAGPAAVVVASRETGTSVVAPALETVAPPAARTTPSAADHAPLASLFGQASAPSAANQLLAESAILARAQANLSRDPRAALRQLDAHAAAYPRGQLVDEREAMAVEALHRLGETDATRARAQAFLARFAQSIYAPRVRRALDATR